MAKETYNFKEPTNQSHPMMAKTDALLTFATHSTLLHITYYYTMIVPAAIDPLRRHATH